VVEFAELESFQISTLGTVDASVMHGIGTWRSRTPDQRISVLKEGKTMAKAHYSVMGFYLSVSLYMVCSIDRVLQGMCIVLVYRLLTDLETRN
jgi:hypothetical protein